MQFLDSRLRLVVIVWMSMAVSSQAQIDSTWLQWQEDMVTSSSTELRTEAFTSLTTALTHRLSDSVGWQVDLSELRSFAVIYDRDSTFRIVTTQLQKALDEYFHFGIIQFKEKGAVVLLYDHGDLELELVARSAASWRGSLYYELKEFERASDSRRFFVLFGFDSYRGQVHRKVADILAVDMMRAEIDFAQDLFVSKQGSHDQLELAYAGETPIRMHFNDSLDMIVHDHLIPMRSLYEKGKMVMVSDASYEGYRLIDGEWHHVEKIFDQVNEIPLGDGISDSRKQLFEKKN